jgi:hypothetical protein
MYNYHLTATPTPTSNLGRHESIPRPRPSSKSTGTSTSHLAGQRTPNTPPKSTRPPSPPKTPIMHHAIIRQHSNDTPSQPLMTHPANPLVPDNNPPVPAALAVRRPVAQQQQRLGRHELRLAQAGDYARLVDHAVGAADAAAEVGFQLRHLQVVRDEGEGRLGRKAGAVFGE